jgi:hypothetical protein
MIVLLEKRAARKMSIFLDSIPSNLLATSFISSYEINRSPLAYLATAAPAGPDLDFATVDKIDRGIEDDPVRPVAVARHCARSR